MEMLPVRIIAVVFFACFPCTAIATDLTPQQIFATARQVFRAHRPPPPYERYTLVREQQTAEGAPDFEWSYEYRVWCRSSDRAALGRRVFRGRSGALEFMRPAFDEPRDPGPPTADFFERVPVRPQPASESPQPIDTPPPLIGSVQSTYESEYRVLSIETQGTVYHLRVMPLRDPRRNRVRELWIDRETYEIRKAIVTDRLYMLGGPVLDQIDTVSMGSAFGYPVITSIHARAEFNSSSGDGLEVDYRFGDISFPASLPDWYFEPWTYGAHVAEAP